MSILENHLRNNRWRIIWKKQKKQKKHITKLLAIMKDVPFINSFLYKVNRYYILDIGCGPGT